ncbi:MAG: type II secretion system protein GspL [Gammaproteobacteria bacterium]|nr:type II secretion system protein GspL [Gammaproteobacteria bacterium]
MRRLFVRIKAPVVRTEEGVDATVDYLVRDEGGVPETVGRTNAAGLAEFVETNASWALDPARVVVFVSVGDVLSASCEVPGRSVAQMRRAVPYAVEEFVADDIDTMQVACADLVRNEPVRCLVAPRSSVEEWLGLLAEAGIQPGFMTADAMGLRNAVNVVDVLFEDDHALVRAAEQMACVDLPNLAEVVAGITGATDPDQPPALRLINGTAADLPGLELGGFEVEEVPVEMSVLGFLAGEFDGQAVNLLQGDYAVRRRPTGAWSRWRPVAAFAGIGFVVGTALLAAQGFWADYQASRFQEQAVALYRTLYGVDRVAGNPAARMRRLLGQASGTDESFHGLTGQFGAGLSEISGQYELRGVTYSTRRGLDADLVVADDAVLERLGASLRRVGLDMEVISTDSAQSGGRIGARLRVSG